MLINKLLKTLIVLLVLDVITTHIALNNFGTEQNILLLHLSSLFNTSVLVIVYVTHIIGIILILVVNYLLENDIIESNKLNYFPVLFTVLLYIFVVSNNIVQLLKII